MCIFNEYFQHFFNSLMYFSSRVIGKVYKTGNSKNIYLYVRQLRKYSKWMESTIC